MKYKVFFKIFIGLLILLASNLYADSNGHFLNDVRVEWMVEPEPDRNVILLDDFYYVDPSGKQWPAPRGSEINGASIPWLLWNKWIGPPFVGNYRRASVVHDVACDLREKICRSSLTAHRMFYDACLCGGVNKIKAKVMYWAVKTFGPKWGDQDPKDVLSKRQFLELHEIEKLIKENGITENSTDEEIKKFLTRFDPTSK